MSCEFCDGLGGEVLWRDALCRVVLAPEPGYAGLCRVVLNAHVREMTDLAQVDRRRLMEVVFATEAALRTVLRPHKVNLASLGNLTPHLHWHVIPRFPDDPHFPLPVWAAQQREPARAVTPLLSESLGKQLAATIS